MRRVLLASAALFGASVSLANAQTAANPSQGQLAAPYGNGPAANNNNNAWGIANTPSGSKEAGPVSTMFPPNTNAVPVAVTPPALALIAYSPVARASGVTVVR